MAESSANSEGTRVTPRGFEVVLTDQKPAVSQSPEEVSNGPPAL